MNCSLKGMVVVTVFKNEVHDEERAFYGVKDAVIDGCKFQGPADGESALKETGNLTVKNCEFLLRYPLWHNSDSVIDNCRMTETCRAALWYDKNTVIKNSVLGGSKAVRECDNTEIHGTKINSTEFGWFCRRLTMLDCELNSEYPFLHTSDIRLDNFRLKGKYSFQYTENVEIRNSVLDTKDAFWHGKNITVYDSVVKGEYLGWYSENVKFVRCKIIGTQPLCYCKNLVLEDCEMIDCDLSFERSDVNASIKGGITSVKNPRSGRIAADCIGELIADEYAQGSSCEIIVKSKGECSGAQLKKCACY